MIEPDSLAQPGSAKEKYNNVQTNLDLNACINEKEANMSHGSLFYVSKV